MPAAAIALASASVATFQGAANSLKAAGDIVRTLINMKVTADVQAKVIELQGIIMSAQTDAMSAQASQMDLLNRVRELESELSRSERWAAEQQRYELTRVMASTVYVVKQSAMQPGEPLHAICPECYEKERKSILQATPRSEGAAHGCPACKAKYQFWKLEREST